MNSTTKPIVATVLVNWKGADDTIECIRSLRGSDYAEHVVIVVENGSPDGSLKRLQDWASGTQSTSMWTAPAHLPGVTYDERVGLPFASLTAADIDSGAPLDPSLRLFLIDSGSNRGFAGGVNVGCAFALRRLNASYVWVLNNDTVVARDCLSKMVSRMERGDGAGMCGSRILFYRQPNTVQVLGGARFRRWLGISRNIGFGQSADLAVNGADVERQLDHLCGASMLVSKSFLQEIGPMEERYFLYYEEADWACRSKGRFTLAYSDDARLYHKEGAAIGSSHDRRSRSPLSAYYLVRSRLIFTRTMHPWALPTVYLYTTLVAIRAFLERRIPQARAIAAALLGLSRDRALSL